MCSPPGPLIPFPFLDLSVSSVEISGNMLLGITFSAAPESITKVTFFHVPSISWDQVIQSHDPRVILPDEQVGPGLNDVRCWHEGSCHVCNLPRALAYEF